MTKRINVLLLALLCYVPALAAPADSIRHRPRTDTLKVGSRALDEKKIAEYRADPEFRYNRPQEGLTWWERFLIWLSTWIGRILGFATRTTLGKFFFYAFWSLLILYVLLKLLNVDVKDLFFRSPARQSINFKIAEENIHALDFEKLIQEAVEDKRYRDAVRLIFLYSLRKLSDAQLIQWMPGKTNDEYLSELKQHPARPRLQELRYYFDYAWYGHFEVSDETYAGVNQTFRQFNETLR